MAMFNFTMKNREKQMAEREIAPSLLELYNLGQQPTVQAPTNTNLNVDLPPTPQMTKQDVLTGMMRAGAYPEVTQNVLQSQFMPSSPDLQRGSFYDPDQNRHFLGFTGKDGGVYEYTGSGIKPAGRNARLVSTQITGGAEDVIPTSTQLGKVQVGMDESEVTTRTNLLAMMDLVEYVSGDDYIGGITGDAVSRMNSFVAQARQSMNIDSVLTPDGKLDETKVQLNKENMDRFRRAAINDDRVDSAIMELAYIKAKSLDPGGRISDADVRFAEKMFRAGADKASMITLLRDNMRRITRAHNQKYLVNKKRHPKLRGTSLRIEDVIGDGFPEDDDDVTADSILQREFPK